MRFVYDIEWNHPEFGVDQVGGRVLVSSRPLIGACRERPTYQGASAEVMLFSTANEDEFVLSGTVEDLRKHLREALEMLDDLEASYKEDFADHVAHAVQCHICETWYDGRCFPIDHPDGCGNICIGDRTVFLGARDIEVKVAPQPGALVVSDTWISFSFEKFSVLKKGDVFRISNPIDGDTREYIARSDGFSRFHQNRNPPCAQLGVLVDYEHPSKEAMRQAQRAAEKSRS